MSVQWVSMGISRTSHDLYDVARELINEREPTDLGPERLREHASRLEEIAVELREHASDLENELRRESERVRPLEVV